MKQIKLQASQGHFPSLSPSFPPLKRECVAALWFSPLLDETTVSILSTVNVGSFGRSRVGKNCECRASVFVNSSLAMHIVNTVKAISACWCLQLNPWVWAREGTSLSGGIVLMISGKAFLTHVIDKTNVLLRSTVATHIPMRTHTHIHTETLTHNIKYTHARRQTDTV